MLEEALPGRGELDAAAVAVKQALVQLDLELPDLAAQGRLRDAQRERGAGEAAQLAHADEVFDLAEVHGGYSRKA